MTNEVFNGSRFGAWFKYDLQQMWRNQMKTALGTGLSGLVFYAIVILFNLVVEREWSGPSFDSRVLVFFIAFTVLELRQTRTYGFLTDKAKGSAWLMAPASTLEKWTGMLIMTLIVFPVLFLVSYLGVDWLLCTIDHTCGQSLILGASSAIADANSELAAQGEIMSWGIVIWFLISATFLNFLYFLLCGICFKKNKILWGLAIIFVVSMASSALSVLVFENGGNVDVNITNVEDFKAMITNFSALMTVVTVALAGGVFYRLKTIKH